jgi:4-hydroxy-3-methylbut-2-enyl diphosphate reductase
VANLPIDRDEPKIAYLTQTTLSMDDARVIINAIHEHYPQVKEPPSEDICYATTNRQHAVSTLAPQADLVIVVGSKNSSNSVRLTEIAKNVGTPAYLVDDVGELRDEWFQDVGTLVLTAGASAPEHLVREIIDHLREHQGAAVEQQQASPEDVNFNLPRSLRVLQESAVR